MSKSTRNNGKPWTAPAKDQLRPTRGAEHAYPGYRSQEWGAREDAVRTKAADLHVSLKPTNQSPYGTVSRKGKS